MSEPEAENETVVESENLIQQETLEPFDKIECDDHPSKSTTDHNETPGSSKSQQPPTKRRRKHKSKPSPPKPKPKPKPKRSATQESKDQTNVKEKLKPMMKGYDDDDTGNEIPSFEPNREPGMHLPNDAKLTNELDFFQLFFSDEIIESIVRHTNTYAWLNIGKKPSYAAADGSWTETNSEEMKRFIALLIYQGIVRVPKYEQYWSTKTLYNGLWARDIMSRNRFKALLAFLHVVDPYNEDANDKLRKVSPFISHFQEACRTLYQPDQNVAVDERIVKSKHCSGIRQFIKNKPVKFGIKLWVLADSKNGYTSNFEVYAGKNGTEKENDLGLGYNTVWKLCQWLQSQGYHVYFDNFYTSPQLVNDLFEKGTPSCGTITQNRKGYPVTMKDGKSWSKQVDRGDMRWTRDGVCLILQWKDNKIVTMVSSIDKGNGSTEVKRKVKGSDLKWGTSLVKQPTCIQRYNQFMNGVDRSDQHLAKYNLLRKCLRWWKTLFFHMIDISLVNAFILFQSHCKANPRNKSLNRPQKYGVLEFREAVIRQILGLGMFGNPPVPVDGKHSQGKQMDLTHFTIFGDKKRNCKLCYSKDGTEAKVFSYCGACNVYLHHTKQKNCALEWHSQLNSK